MQAIANAERSAGELEAAEAAAAAQSHSCSSKVAGSTRLIDLHGNPLVGAPRFPLGAPIQCRLGEHKWASGAVMGHLYREKAWPDNRRAPYQVKIDDGPTIFAPADVDDCIRSGLRFKVGSVVECYLGTEEGWNLGVVVNLFHREPSWEASKWVPYQIKLEGVPAAGGGSTLIWAPIDDDTCVRGLVPDRSPEGPHVPDR